MNGVDFTKDKIYRVFDKLIRCIYPKHCPVCDRLIPLNEDYCSCSRNESKKISDNYCHHCGSDTLKCVCKIGNSVYLPEIAGVYFYDGKIRADILDLKFNNNRRVAAGLGFMMAERCAVVYSDIDFDAVTFVPMSEASKNIRGFNQSQLLAQKIAEQLFISCEDLLEKTRETRAQHKLGGEERIENVKNSVGIKDDAVVRGKSILICDDVKTTGATLNQCVEALQKAGAERICCICAAITEFSK